jgi:hypothetical protein
MSAVERLGGAASTRTAYDYLGTYWEHALRNPQARRGTRTPNRLITNCEQSSSEGFR